MGLAVFAAGGQNAFNDPFAIHNYPTIVQAAFRRKLYGLLLVESLFSLAISSVIFFVPDIAGPAGEHAKTHLATLFILAGLTLLFLMILYCVKYHHPVNLIVFCKVPHTLFFWSFRTITFLLLSTLLLAISLQWNMEPHII
jgi:hypothetical protein